MKALVRLVGAAAFLFGLGLAGAALMTDSGELQALFAIFAMAGGMIALAGGGILALTSLFGRGAAGADDQKLSPEQQQLLDSREFQSARQRSQGGKRPLPS